LVLGVIAIIIASLGILSNGCGGVVAPLVQAQMAKMVPPGSNPILDAQVAIGKKYLWFIIINAATMTGLGVVLLSAGIGMVRRRPWSRVAILTWAWLRTVYALPASYVGYLNAMETMNAMVTASNSGAPGTRPLPAGMSAFFQVFGAVGVFVGAAMVCAFPIFALIWFNRGKIKAEIASWAQSITR
jgi:hypothetical protein